ncbi:hypothetical protein Tco_0177289, partial [Tanacetum coccineum]
DDCGVDGGVGGVMLMAAGDGGLGGCGGGYGGEARGLVDRVDRVAVSVLELGRKFGWKTFLAATTVAEKDGGEDERRGGETCFIIMK